MLTAFLLGVAAINLPLNELVSDPALKGAVVGVMVQDELGNVVAQNSADVRVMPASNNKLLTVAYALHTLTPTFRAKTSFYREGGEVWVDATGDPTLSYEQLREAGRKLGVDRNTRIRVRQAYAPGVPQGWNHGYLTARYAAQIEAFSVDRAGFELWADAKGVTLEPETYGVQLVFKPGTKPIDFTYDLQTRKIVATGALPKERTRLATLAVPDPSEAACRALGGRERGAIDRVPDREPDYVIESQPMSEIAGMCLKPSDNNIAEHLLLLSALKEGPLAADPYPQATDRLELFMAKVVGCDADDIRPWDGSGLSRHDFVTARALSTLLQWALRQPWREIWMDSQAVSGKPGTLSGRLKEVDFRGKTGYIDAVTSLSGYLFRKDGTVWTVSVVANNFKKPPSEVRGAIDRFITSLATFEPFPPKVGIIWGGGPVIVPFQKPSVAFRHRFGGSDIDRGLAFLRAHPRDEPHYETVH